ncbi:hypothetical protein ZWY2020_011736 [Hordeum vulgare]|nr:hypothetical protein ZWY2020_011736 [Hordeum vulgare]
MDNARVRRRRDDPEIGDDAVREVLARLPGLRELLRCAATCKHWRRLVLDRAFLRRLGLWPDTARRPSILAGVFTQSCYSRDDSRDKGNLYDAPPRFISLQSGLDDVHDPPRTFYSFVTIDGDDRGLFHLARPLAARRGFLVARVLPPYSPDNRDDDEKLLLAVCRPLLDRRSTHLLPPPPFSMDDYLDNNLVGCTIVTAADHTAGDGNHKQHQQSMFKVILLYKDNNDGFVYTCDYSSDAAGWSAPVRAYHASPFTRCGPRAGLVTHGLVHWLLMHYQNHHIYALKVTMETLRPTLTKIPIEVHPTMPRPPIPCTVQGMLSFVTIREEDGVAELWTKQEQDGATINKKEQHDNVVWENSELTNLGRERISSVFFAESRGALLVEQHGGALSIVDLETKDKLPMHLKDETSEQSRGTCRFLESCSSSCCRGYIHGYSGMTCLQTPPVLYEMDWVFPSTLVYPEAGGEKQE